MTPEFIFLLSHRQIGSVLEWYDFAIFGAMADVLADEFLPEGNSEANLLEIFAVFGSAFLMRPLGGILIGYIGDTHGRKRALEISIMMMVIPSFLMGCLPRYSDIQGWATALLVILRLSQGLAVGGELISAFVFCIESAAQGYKVFWGGITMNAANAGCLLGVTVAAIVRSVMSKEDLHSYGWRICFWLGIVVGIAGVMLRRGLKDTAEFEEIKKEQEESGQASNPLSVVLKEYWTEILQVIGVISIYCAGFYTFFVWWPFLLTDEYGEKEIDNYQWINASMLACLIIIQVIVSFYATMTENGHIKSLRIGAIGIILWAVPGFLLVQTRTVGGVT